MAGHRQDRGTLTLSHPTGNANVRNALRALQERNLLAAYYTTVAWDSESWWNRLLPSPAVRELRRRGYPGITKELIHTAAAREMCRVLLGRAGVLSKLGTAREMFSIERICWEVDGRTARAVARCTPRAVYAYEHSALQTFRMAKRMNVHTIYELPIAYGAFRREFYQVEAELQPEFAATLEYSYLEPVWQEREAEELALADELIVPSTFVQSSLPSERARTARVIPYGMPSENLLPVRREPPRGRPLRVLYVGQLSQRKGISYLLAALRQVETAVEFSMIGMRGTGECRPLDEALRRYRWRPSVPNSVVLEEMARHDVLVFPTLLEGMALVVLEAMSRGMVVITTPNSGAVGTITDGKDGFIVPIRSAEAIAEKLEMLDRDRDRLEAMSQAALRRARECSWAAYRERLGATISEVVLGAEVPCK
jgi:glycosyltransferase involved in cell wall biosynthesis